MKEFKFLRPNEKQFTLDEEWYETYQPYILPYQRTELDDLFLEVEDRDTGEYFGIPRAVSRQLSIKGREIFRSNQTTRGERYTWGAWEYWIDNVYRVVTTQDTLVLEVLIMIPNIMGRGAYHRIVHRITYE